MIPENSIRAARELLRGVTHVTPVLTSRALNTQADATLWFKAENLQKTGSFKARGAYVRVHAAASAPPVASLVTASSGNHGQAVAWAARAHGLPAHIVVPTTAAEAKVAAALAYGATVERAGTQSRDRLARAADLAQQPGWIYIPPYDDDLVMSGQATVGAEILDQVSLFDTVVVPIGGGGLIAGVASAVKAAHPDVAVIGVEPEGAASSFMSRQAGSRVELPSGLSIADGLTTVLPGARTFPIIQEAVDRLVTVSDASILSAMALLMTRLKTVIEPSGAAAAAWALGDDQPLRGRRAVVILSGGNIDPERLSRLFRT